MLLANVKDKASILPLIHHIIFIAKMNEYLQKKCVCSRDTKNNDILAECSITMKWMNIWTCTNHIQLTFILPKFIIKVSKKMT